MENNNEHKLQKKKQKKKLIIHPKAKVQLESWTCTNGDYDNIQKM